MSIGLGTFVRSVRASRHTEEVTVASEIRSAVQKSEVRLTTSLVYLPPFSPLSPGPILHVTVGPCLRRTTHNPRPSRLST